MIKLEIKAMVTIQEATGQNMEKEIGRALDRTSNIERVIKGLEKKK